MSSSAPVRVLYRRLAGPLLRSLLFLYSRFDSKAERTRRCKRNWRESLKRLPERSDKFRVLVHAASVGEFEQAKPVIERIKTETPDVEVVASFFSSSGYQANHTYEPLSASGCLPLDSWQETFSFLESVSPNLIVVIRYDLWPNFLGSARDQGIPVALVCATMSASRGPRQWYRKLMGSSLYRDISFISAVDEENRREIQSAGGNRVRADGDTRYDRVLERVAPSRLDDELTLVRELAGHRRIVVAGSTWAQDEILLARGIDPKREFLVIAPHEVDPASLERVMKVLPQLTRLSSALESRPKGEIAGLLVDRVGILAELYGVGEAAFVGGGFRAGVHSVLEPAAHGLAIASGPRIHRSPDARQLQAEGLLTLVESSEDLAEWLARIEGRDTGVDADTRRFVERRAGATDRIVGGLRKADLLPMPSVPKHAEPTS